MLTLDDFKKIYLVQNLTEQRLEKLLAIAREEYFDEQEVVFLQGAKAENFYMLKSGKVLLKVDASPTVTISLGAVKPGYSFGWSALLGGEYTAHAHCVEACQIMVLPGKAFKEVLDEDHAMGYEILQGVFRIMEHRLTRRTEQLVKTMRKQMEIWDLF